MELKEAGLASPPKEVQEKSPAGGLGVSLSFLFLPPRMGARGLRQGMSGWLSDSHSERRTSK